MAVTAEGRRVAIARLLGLDQGDPGVSRFLDNARADGTDLSTFWAVLGPSGRPLEVALGIPSSGRTAMAFVSPPAAGAVGAAGAAARTACIEAVYRQLSCRTGAQTVRLVQALVEPDHQAQLQAFLAAGFSRLAELAYLRRPIPLRSRDERPAWPAGITVMEVSRLPKDRARPLLAAALAASYEGTLDCAALCGLRDVEDVLDSHLAVGSHDPSLWSVVLRGDEAVGCMLLSPCPAQETVELVYLGLAPGARGLGIARALLNHGLSRLSGRAERTLACAVDLSNEPALRLYRAARFKQFATRTALIRPI